MFGDGQERIQDSGFGTTAHNPRLVSVVLTFTFMILKLLFFVWLLLLTLLWQLSINVLTLLLTLSNKTCYVCVNDFATGLSRFAIGSAIDD